MLLAGTVILKKVVATPSNVNELDELGDFSPSSFTVILTFNESVGVAKIYIP